MKLKKEAEKISIMFEFYSFFIFILFRNSNLNMCDRARGVDDVCDHGNHHFFHILMLDKIK